MLSWVCRVLFNNGAYVLVIFELFRLELRDHFNLLGSELCYILVHDES